MMIRHIVGSILLSLLGCGHLSAQEHVAASRAILFYNTENLFDTLNDSLTNDDDFTPEGMMHWNSGKYYHKINNIAKVLFDANGWDTPFIVGLSEVENERVLRDLLYVGGLSHLHYKFVHFDGPDPRGIDVALLYNSKQFRVLSDKAICVTTPARDFKTRDILYVKGVSEDGDTLHLFVNHFPSRRGGQAQSEAKRILAATTLYQTIDSILNSTPQAKVFAMGDFNDTPSDVSIADCLLKPFLDHSQLIALAKPMADSGKGSNKFAGEWNMIDQMFISESFADEVVVGDSLSANGFSTVELPYMLEDDEASFGKKLIRTYMGPRYVGGYSDHLPIIFRYRSKPKVK